MAEYLPPTENLPKFNEFVFDDAYSIEGLDRRVVHKAGTETITGNKTITGTLTATNTTTSLTATTKNELVSFTGLNSLYNTSGSNVITNFSGSNLMTAFTTGTNTLTTITGKTLINSTTGQIELKTGAGGITGINIENTSTTTGGITLKTNGSTGDINLTSAYDVILTASAGQITLTSPIVSASSKYQLSTAPLISFCMVFIPETLNTTASQLGVGYPNADNTSVNINFRVPYNCRVVGWGLTGNAQTHSAVTMTFKINTGLGSTGGTTYFSQTGVLIENGLTSTSAVANISGSWGGFISIGTASPITTMVEGDRFYAWIGSSATMTNDFIVQVYFQQVV